MKLKYIKLFESFGTSGQAPPYWAANGVRIELDDVQNYLDENKIPIEEIDVNDIFHLCTHKDKTDKETLDRSERSDLDFPIIVLKKHGGYDMVIDGHHRLLKAKNNNISKIKARVFNLEEAPNDFQKVFS